MPAFRTMIFDIYEDHFGDKDISKFEIILSNTKIKNNGKNFVYAINSKIFIGTSIIEQQFKGFYEGTECIVGTILINLQGIFSIKGQTILPSKHDYIIKLK
jgi:hypothetical protein